MVQYRFEELREEQLTNIKEIYNHYVLNTTATFHAHPLAIDEMKELVFFDNPMRGLEYQELKAGNVVKH